MHTISNRVLHCYFSLDTPDAPGQPKVKEFGPTFANITWTPPTNDGGKPITGNVLMFIV